MHLKLGKILLHVEQLQLALHHLREAADVLKVRFFDLRILRIQHFNVFLNLQISHGDFARLTKEHLNPLLGQAQKAFNKAAKQKAYAAAHEDDEDEED